MKMHLPQMEEPELDVAPLIDMVFLLLVFFMATASLVKSEGDLGIRLPGMVAQAKSVDMSDEQIVEITENGTVYLNGRQFDNPATQELPQLYTTLLRYKAASDAARNEAMITIAANDNTKQQRVIDVMNACAAAGIKSVTFSAAAN